MQLTFMLGLFSEFAFVPPPAGLPPAAAAAAAAAMNED
jgi:hypothetical protein